jgi:GDP-L-fucose synthase
VVTLVAGGTGLVGSAIKNEFEKNGHTVQSISRKEIDLLDRQKTFEYMLDLKPEIVIDSAAIVGGINANMTRPVEFLSQNLRIQTNLMDAAHAAGVRRFVFIGSSCIYPRNASQPIQEESLLTGILEPTNSAYAIAKISGIELIRSYRSQFGHKWISVMPTNMYGPGDNFSITDGHVLPALIHKFVVAVERQDDSIDLWGDGSPKREFLHVGDFASALNVILEKYDSDLHINVGTGLEISVRDLAKIIGEEVDFRGIIRWDSRMPNGMPRKLLNVERLFGLGWSPKIGLQEGIRDTVAWFRANREKVRV